MPLKDLKRLPHAILDRVDTLKVVNKFGRELVGSNALFPGLNFIDTSPLGGDERGD